MENLAIIPALLMGIAIAVQGPTNSALARTTGSAQASLISFAGGVLVLGCLLPFLGTGNLSLALQQPAWQLLGGIYGAAVVFGTIIALPHLGAALTSTIFMLGQIGMSMFIDSCGLLHVNVVPLNLWRIAGFAIIALGILLVYLGKRKNERKDSAASAETVSTPSAEVSPAASANTGSAPSADSGSAASAETSSAACPVAPARSRTLPYALLAFTLGVAGAAQGPTNAALSRSIGSIEASFFNFCVGVLCALVLTLVLTRGHLAPLRGAKPWQMVGGLYGALGVSCNILATLSIGPSSTTAFCLFSQLISSMLIDAHGWLLCTRIPMNAERWAGIIAIGIGIILATIGKML